jgi:TrmH family RNA methyltransferase
MISKNKIKYIRSLQNKKARDEEKLYLIEGGKMILEYLHSGIRLKFLASEPEFSGRLMPDEKALIDEMVIVNHKDLTRMSSLKTPHNAIAAVSITDEINYSPPINDCLCIGLESVQDPGNLGTIMRAAAWFGFKHIICSEKCADVYNPKVIQASMGALINTKVYFLDLFKLLQEARDNNLPVYGTFLEGESVYDSNLGKRGIILFGNESKGISDDLLPLITSRLVIPKFTSSAHGVESLNVGMAASVVFSEFARRKC